MPSQLSADSERSVFISYRREDSQANTGRIYDRLIQKFGPDSIFKDVENIGVGEDFQKALQHQLAGCRILLAIVGQRWADDPRLQDEGDFVRIEVECGLNPEREDILVIPVLVSNASMPPADQLPSSLKEFAFRNAIQVRPDPDFHQDMDKLIKILTDKLPFHDHPAEADPGEDPGKEKPFTKKMTQPLGGMQQIQLDESKRMLFKDMDAFGCWERLEPIFDVHGEREDEIGKDIRGLYLLVQIELNPLEALSFTDRTLDNNHDSQAYFIQMEYFDRKGDRKGNQKIVGTVQGMGLDDAYIQGGVMKHCLDEYSQAQTKGYLDEAESAYKKLISGNDEPIIKGLKAYYSYRNGDKEAFVKEEKDSGSDEESFYIRKFKNQINASKLVLEVHGIPYPCNHGDILGRNGDVAKAHLSAFPTVHGRHAEVFCCFGQWHIRALPTTQNPTYVDDHLVDPGETHELTGEHRFRLSSKFEGKLKVVPINPSERV